MLNSSLHDKRLNNGDGRDIGSIYSREKDGHFLGYSNAYAEDEINSQKNLTD